MARGRSSMEFSAVFGCRMALSSLTQKVCRHLELGNSMTITEVSGFEIVLSLAASNIVFLYAGYITTSEGSKCLHLL
jgi:hypothetical protein